MPNWCFNAVEIQAPLGEVRAYLATDYFMDDPSRPISRFNLHRLFPDRFSADDLCGHNAWDYDWMVKHTGAKWNPNICVREREPGLTVLDYDTAWMPNNLLLERLHKMTGWTIHNTFEEEQPEFEGDLHCEG